MSNAGVDAWAASSAGRACATGCSARAGPESAMTGATSARTTVSTYVGTLSPAACRAARRAARADAEVVAVGAKQHRGQAVARRRRARLEQAGRDVAHADRARRRRTRAAR